MYCNTVISFLPTMFSSHIFMNTFVIPPNCLSKEWKRKFLEIVKKTKTRTVSQVNGAILEVEDLVKCEYPKLEDGMVQASIIYRAIAFNPSIGAVYNGAISLILPLGIIIESEGLVKIVVQPINLPTGYKYDSARKVFTNGIHSYSVGDIVRFQIVTVKYKTNEINCIGSMKNISREEDENLPVIEPPDEFID